MSIVLHLFLILTGCTIITVTSSSIKSVNLEEVGDVSDSIVSTYQDVADQIIDIVTKGSLKGQVYKRLANFTDHYPARLLGSDNLQKATLYMKDKMVADGLDNVHHEFEKLISWGRGEEELYILSPVYRKLDVTTLGTSVGTKNKTLKAQAVVVRTFQELTNGSVNAKGKIVVFNQDYEGYGVSVKYREFGASNAFKVGAIAALVRSVTPFSIYSVHQGVMTYTNQLEKIPGACITVEDAEMMQRMQDRGEAIFLTLKLAVTGSDNYSSPNTVAEIKGNVYPEQVVLISGHLDSWDLGQGAMDDGGGAFISWEALTIIKTLGLKPKRTIRAVLWTGEEFGGLGSKAYFERHKSNASNYSILMESDIGTFAPFGLGFSGSDSAGKIVQQVLNLLQSVNSSRLVNGGDTGTDVAWWSSLGVPTAGLMNQANHYFYYHHTHADTMSVQNSDQMDMCAAVWAVVSYVLADLDSLLPR